jgi:hypothetical protein
MERGVIAFDLSELARLPAVPRTNGCDFCAFDPPAWRYPARTVGLGAVIYGDTLLRPISIGGWRACQGCSDMIDAGDWPGLARRTLRSLNIDLSKAGPGTRVKLLARFHLAHEAFKKARSGTREAVA